MKIKTTFAALALIVAPGFALAEGCPHSDAIKDASISCAVGFTYDTKTGACVAGTNS